MKKDKNFFHGHARLAEERVKKWPTQQEAADLFGVTRVTWGQCERGNATPSGDVLAGLAQQGVDVLYILTGKRSETDDEFSARHQRIRRMVELVNAMPLREFTRLRLSALMKGDVEQDGLYIANAIRNEALGIDFVTGKPIDPSPAPAPVKVKQKSSGPGSSIQVGGSIQGSTVFNGETDGDSAAAGRKRATRTSGARR